MKFATPVGEGPATAGRLLDVRNPADGSVVDRVPVCDPAGLDAVVTAARSAFPHWAGVPLGERAERLKACGRAVHEHVEELAVLLTREQGKPIAQARDEVRLAADWFTLTAELELPAEAGADQASVVGVARVPHGPVAAIAPYNFPVILSVTKVAPALLAGNTVVLKPSPLTPLTSLRIGEILAAVLPRGVLTVVSGTADLGAALVAHPGIRLVSFTGSIDVGRAIAVEAASRFKPVVLELGGNDACIVLPGADIDALAPDIFAAAMPNTGQFCAAIKRVYVHERQRAGLVSVLSDLAGRAVAGDGLDPASRLGPLTDPAQPGRLADLVAETVHRGAQVTAGGRVPTGPGAFFPATVVTGLPEGTGLELREQFGPVIPVIGYADVDQAVARANATPYGLGGSVWGDPSRASECADRLECGTTWINTHGELRHDAPFGGFKDSGVGVEYGYWGLLEYTRLKVRNERLRTGGGPPRTAG